MTPDKEHGLACRVAKAYVGTEGFLTKHNKKIKYAWFGLMGTYVAGVGLYWVWRGIGWLTTYVSSMRAWTIDEWTFGAIILGVVSTLTLYGFSCYYIANNFHRIGKWAHKKAEDC